MDASDFFEAIDDLDIDKIRWLLSTGKVSPNIEHPSWYLPVLKCVMPEPFTDDCNEEDVQRCEMLKLLIQHGADINVQAEVKTGDEAYYDIRQGYYMEGLTPAMFAARWGYLRCLRFLDESGADLNVVTESKHTALLLAVEKGRAKCVEYLTQRVPLSMLDYKAHDGETALMYAARNFGENRLLIVQHLLDTGASIHLQNDRGDTALMVAVESKNVEVVRLLLDSGAEVSTIRDDGETPLTKALDNNKPSVVMSLLMSGADPTFSYKGLDRFHENVAVGRDAVVRALVSHGFPPLDLQVTIFQDDDDESDLAYLEELPISPLGVALLFDKPDIARFFVENRFFTRFDILQLCWNPVIRRTLQRYNKIQSLEILDCLSTRPQPLLTLSFVAISSVLTEDLVRLCLNVYSQKGGRDTWLFRPTFKERVRCLGLPPPLTRALLREN